MARSNMNKQTLPDAGEADSNITDETAKVTSRPAAVDDDNDENPSSADSDKASQSSASSENSTSNATNMPASPNSSSRGDKRKRSLDDTGQADEDGGSTDSPIPPPWQPQNVQSTIEFTHLIKEYASKRDSGCKKAEYSSVAVDDHGNRWRLIVYVNGNGRASNHHLSLFLQVADADDLPFGWKKAVSYVLTLEHPGGTSLSYSKRNPDKTFKLCPKAIDWGWSQFITSDRIQQEGFVSNDSLTVRAQVTVKSSSVSIDEEDSELYLKCAVEEGDVDAVQTCLENGASVNCQFKDDLYTPLHTACSSGTTTGSVEVLQLLLEEGADPNASNKWKETPLLIAANNGHRLGVAALLKHGADPSLCSEAGWSALTFAAHKGYDDIVALLLRSDAPVNSRVTEDLSTPLHKACAGSKAGHTASVKLLLEADADVHALNKWRETPLLTAANHGQSTAVDSLLSHGADPCKCTDTGWSPLSIAAYKGHDEVVRMLLEEGAPTEEDDPTLSALLQAATKGLPDTVELLLRHGADHTVTTKKGDTALSILVEQNLIDAAVDMVTDYNASIPRCSRDRKKVQRARLLINHRMKQIERVGKSLSSDEEGNAEDGENQIAQHLSKDEEQSIVARSGKKKKKGKKKSVSAEEKAKQAEEALLLELEMEEAEAKKEEEEATKKQAKKKKKKERERQQKLKEDQERREREQKEQQERERVRREQQAVEQKQRVEREKKLKAQQEAELKVMMEKEKAAAELKKKETERKERESELRRREEKKRDHTNPASPSGSTSSTEILGRNNIKQSSGALSTAASSVPVPLGPSSARKNATPAAAAQVSNRRWENKGQAKVQSPSPPPRDTLPSKPASTISNGPHSTPHSAPLASASVASVEYPAEATGQVGKLQGQLSETKAKENNETPNRMRQPEFETEHPTIALHRKEKMTGLLRSASSSIKVVDSVTIKRAMWRWIVRAAHSNRTGMDPLIPNADNGNELTGFFQRNLISEVRRRSGPAFPINIEQLKEAGSILANMCQAVAREMSQFRQQIMDQLASSDWNDTQAGMGYEIQNGASNIARVYWANQAQVFMPVETLTSLRDRFTGNTSRFLATVFAAKVWDETKHLIIDNTDLDVRLKLETKAYLSTEANVTAELYADPFTASPGNLFWSSFRHIDCFFGGLPPFGVTLDAVDTLAQQGGTVLSLLPYDNFVATQYLRGMLNTLDAATSRGVPLSFLVLMTDESLPDPCAADLSLVDTRFGNGHGTYLRRRETLLSGHHSFVNGEGHSKVASKDSALIVLQNEASQNGFVSTDRIVDLVKNAMLYTSSQQIPSVQSEFRVAPSTPLSSPDPYFNTMMSHQPAENASPGSNLFVSTDLGGFGSSMPKPFPSSENTSRGGRRGRLFDLVDDVEEDNQNDVDLVSGIMSNLDLFQSNSTGSEIDIEAISLMGIGGSSLSLPPRNSGSGTFG